MKIYHKKAQSMLCIYCMLGAALGCGSEQGVVPASQLSGWPQVRQVSRHVV